MKPLQHYLLVTVSAAALTGNAVAADVQMPVKARPPAASVATWSGPYIGVTLGAALNNSRFTDVDQFFFLLPGGPNNEFWNNTHAAFAAGGLIGYNWQAGSVVFGVEGDWNWISGKANATIPSGIPVFASSDLRWMSTVRGRVGYTIMPSTLLYVTGGAAWASFSDAWGSPTTPTFTMSDSFVRTGWTAGGGIEQMFATHWTARAEVLYADFGTHEVISTAGGFYRTEFKHSVTQVRAALNWKW